MRVSLLIGAFVVRVILAQCPGNCRGTCTQDAKCVCRAGFTGAACDKLACPLGPAFSAKAPPAATGVGLHHLLRPCSGVGSCSGSTGVCTCQAGFGGAACEHSA